jgi:hypothetical protein
VTVELQYPPFKPNGEKIWTTMFETSLRFSLIKHALDRLGCRKISAGEQIQISYAELLEPTIIRNMLKLLNSPYRLD